MQVNSIQSRQTPSFSGKLYVKNLANKTSKTYKLPYEADNTLRNLYKDVHLSTANTEKGTFGALNKYLDAISEVTGDSFVKELPPVKKSAKKQDILNPGMTFTSLIKGQNYTELSSNDFEIIHDTQRFV